MKISFPAARKLHVSRAARPPPSRPVPCPETDTDPSHSGTGTRGFNT